VSAAWSVVALRLAQIIWLDLLLSGDNAVVIALASRRLPPDKRRRAAALGAAAAVALRIVFAAVLLQALRLPGLELAGALLLLWIAIRLADQPHDPGAVAQAKSVWSAVRIIAFADALMSLDNVLAITAAARGDVRLVIFGLLVSLPLVVFGASLFLRVLARWPWLLSASAALIGWSAGQMALDDAVLQGSAAARIPHAALWSGGCGAVVVLLAAALRGRLRRR
jgi:YjbE family integral membrane protein